MGGDWAKTISDTRPIRITSKRVQLNGVSGGQTNPLTKVLGANNFEVKKNHVPNI